MAVIRVVHQFEFWTAHELSKDDTQENSKAPRRTCQKSVSDGSVEKNRKTWEQAYGDMPESVQWLVEHTHYS